MYENSIEKKAPITIGAPNRIRRSKSKDNIATPHSEQYKASVRASRILALASRLGTSISKHIPCVGNRARRPRYRGTDERGTESVLVFSSLACHVAGWRFCSLHVASGRYLVATGRLISKRLNTAYLHVNNFRSIAKNEKICKNRINLGADRWFYKMYMCYMYYLTAEFSCGGWQINLVYVRRIHSCERPAPVIQFHMWQHTFI